MARKSARALAAAESTQASYAVEATPAPVAASELAPKSCLTCARVITPRAKWAKDWAGIKYCSDRCRSTRPGKVVVRFQTKKDLGRLVSVDGFKVEESTQGVADVSVDVETFVEAVVLQLAKKSKRDELADLDDVQEAIKEYLKLASISAVSSGQHRDSSNDTEAEARSISSKDAADVGTVASHPLWKALDSPPGFRERVRRAARRLALGITHDSDPRQTNIVTTEHGRIELIHTGKSLRTVQDLSFAKGVMHIRSRG